MWSLKNVNLWLIGSLIIYFLGSLLFVFAIKKSSLSLAVATAPLAIAIIGLILGYFYFGERLSIIQYFGVALGLIALSLLFFPFPLLQK
jgi:drug/metabolite transporter (DMT)-like permease